MIFVRGISENCTSKLFIIVAFTLKLFALSSIVSWNKFSQNFQKAQENKENHMETLEELMIEKKAMDMKNEWKLTFSIKRKITIEKPRIFHALTLTRLP